MGDNEIDLGDIEFGGKEQVPKEIEMSPKVARRVIILRVLLLSIFIVAAAVCGYEAYIILKNIQMHQRNVQYESFVSQLFAAISKGINSNVLALQSTSAILSKQCSQLTSWPNCTITPDIAFLDIINPLISVGALRTIGYGPFVQPSGIHAFEAFAKSVITSDSQFDSTVGYSPFGFGIYARNPITKARYRETGTCCFGGKRQLIAPVMNVGDLPHNKAAIMYNLYSETVRATALDAMLDGSINGTYKPAISSNIFLVQDVIPRPAALMVYPVYPWANVTSPTGYVYSVINWDSVLNNSIPSFVVGIDVIIHSQDISYSFTINDGSASYVSTGDQHDTNFNSYERSFVLAEFPTEYQFFIYPNNNFDHSAIDIPKIVCAVTVAIFVLSFLLFVLYDYFLKVAARETENFYIKLWREDASIKSARYDHLPIHQSILLSEPVERVTQLVSEHEDTIHALDDDGLSPFDWAIKKKREPQVILQLLRKSLPVNLESGEHISDPSLHRYAWVQVVQFPQYTDLVQAILDDDPRSMIVIALANATDANNRTAVDLACPSSKERILMAMYFLRRYEIVTLKEPKHKSATSLLHIARDHHSEGALVAIKFMLNREQFIRELEVRQKANFDCKYVVGILHSYESSESPAMAKEFSLKGFQEYPHCIVMTAGTRNLHEIIHAENFAGTDWDKIRSVTSELVRGLHHIHEHGCIHGDVKLLNIMRVEQTICFIDLDASAPVGVGFSGAKTSSAYAPPELIYEVAEEIFEELDMDCSEEFLLSSRHKIKHYPPEDGETGYEPVPAAFAHDIWSLGIVLYALFTGGMFFAADVRDNIHDEELMKTLYDFSQEYKTKKLKNVTDNYARNLLSQMLMKDPKQRITLTSALSHPFLTGRSVGRLVGEKAEFDVFISYRVSADLKMATHVFDMLTAANIKVWMDKHCLKPGDAWEEKFCEGLQNSRIFIPLLSRLAISTGKTDFGKYKSSSAVDNVFLEHRLAFECQARGLLDKIYPIFIGDLDASTETFSNYFAARCGPQFASASSITLLTEDDLGNNVPIRSVERRVDEHLYRLGLGCSLSRQLSPRAVIQSIYGQQGLLLEGSLHSALESLVSDICVMLNR